MYTDMRRKSENSLTLIRNLINILLWHIHTEKKEKKNRI